ncbi:redoxin domain-containing protein [Chondrinema litorale]|uniref:redoxin domain-containing protein n=1 Tax=Chondrinema litorale TaxID=2994555 RepID=UPI0025430E59|nr:redoxin domain-containing protein [Chondrinema litorale]UZR98567.1 redoxin domain-containing protein [Chondrinema litorale]
MKRLNFIYAFGYTILLFSFISCSNEKPNNSILTENLPIINVGEKVPDYVFEEVLNSTNTSFSLLNSDEKPVIIELWATWCGSCLPAMKKLDSLKEEYQNEIDIITVSPEDKKRLLKYIENTNSKLPIISDSTFFKMMPFNTIPHSVLIGKNGVIKGITSPFNINTDIIEELIADKPLSLPKEEISESILLIEKVDKEKKIEFKSYDSSSRQYGQPLKNAEGKLNGFVYSNYTLPSIFQDIFEITSYKRLIFKDGLKESDFTYSNSSNRYIFSIEVSPELEDKINETAIDFMNNNFEIYAEKSVDSLASHVLTITNNVLQESNSKEHFEFRGDEYIGRNQKLKKLILYLENMQNIIVADRTGLDGKYDIEFEWEYEKPETLYEVLAKYGLKLQQTENKLPIEVLEIHKKK